jgi:hypothetical protein
MFQNGSPGMGLFTAFIEGKYIFRAKDQEDTVGPFHISVQPVE